MSKSRFIATLVILSALIGIAFLDGDCPLGSARQTWELDTWVTEEETGENGTTQLTVEVIVSGKVTGTRIEHVRLQFFDASGTSIKTVSFGTISGYTRVNTTVHLQALPQRIVVQTGEIHTPDTAKYWISGVNRTSSGEYVEVVQQKNTC